MHRMMLAAFASLAASGTAAPVLAQDSTAQPVQADQIKVQGDKANDKEDMGKADRVICRKIQTIGSRLNSQRVCATAAEWSAMKQENREGLDRMQNQRPAGGG